MEILNKSFGFNSEVYILLAFLILWLILLWLGK